VPATPWDIAFLPQTTSEVAAILITFDHAGLTSPIRYTGNTEAVTSRSNTYQPKGLRASVPAMRPGELPRATLEVEDIDGLLTRQLGALSTVTPLSLLFEVVLLSTPDVPRIVVDGIIEGGPHHNAGIAAFEFVSDDTTGEQYPVKFFNLDYPNVF
jgi:hypothetical protein